MIIDTLEHLPLYHILDEEKVRSIQDFCQKASKEEQEEGRTELCGDELFALVQIYETRKKEETVMEAHRKYLDLQYIVAGQEYFYIHETSKCTVIEDQTPEKDFIFLQNAEPDVRVKAGAGMFVLLFPQDAHMPCIQVESKKKVTKIVFKIRIP